MNKPTHTNPNGAEILPCADDATCEITNCQMCMKEVPISATLSDEERIIFIIFVDWIAWKSGVGKRDRSFRRARTH